MTPRETSWVAIPGQPGPGRPNTRAAGDRRFAETLRLSNAPSDQPTTGKAGVLVDFATQTVVKGMSGSRSKFSQASNSAWGTPTVKL